MEINQIFCTTWMSTTNGLEFAVKVTWINPHLSTIQSIENQLTLFVYHFRSVCGDKMDICGVVRVVIIRLHWSMSSNGYLSNDTTTFLTITNYGKTYDRIDDNCWLMMIMIVFQNVIIVIQGSIWGECCKTTWSDLRGRKISQNAQHNYLHHVIVHERHLYCNGVLVSLRLCLEFIPGMCSK